MKGDKKMKLTVIYHSKSGNTKKMAESIIEGMSAVDGVEAKAFSIDALDVEFAKESAALVFGSPVYAAGMSGAMKTFLETQAGSLMAAGKLVGAFATQNFVHGGADLTMQTILTHMMVMGGMAYSGGGALGQPVIHLGPVAIAGDLDSYTELFKTYGGRMAAKAKELF